jgi:hypothetical protein
MPRQAQLFLQNVASEVLVQVLEAQVQAMEMLASRKQWVYS